MNVPLGKMTKEQLLSSWEEVHGVLSPELRGAFLNRREVDRIIRYPAHAIRSSRHVSPRLAKILADLKSKWTIDGADAGKRSTRTQRRRPGPGKGAEGRDLAAEGQILPLPDNPGASRKKGSPGYRTGEEAELRHIAQKHKWF